MKVNRHTEEAAPLYIPETDMRLNRFLAEAGVCSRRDADEIIFNQQVTVNGAIVTTPAFRIHSQKDAIKVSGKRVFTQPLVYILMNKPERIISTVDDPQKRTTVVDLLQGVRARVYPVGRLDYNTSGVLLLTNDGDLALKLMHPRYGFTKTYHARVRGVPTLSAIQKLIHGVRVPAWSGRYEKTLPARVHLIKAFGKESLLEITLREGRQHQVKNMCAAIGHPVDKLMRVKFGFLTATGLPLGAWRFLSTHEVERLRAFEPKPLTSQPKEPKPSHSTRNKRPEPGRTPKHTKRSSPRLKH